MTDQQMAYIGRCSECNNIAFAAVDKPHVIADVAGEIAEMLRDGWTVERVTSKFVRENYGGCNCGGDIK